MESCRDRVDHRRCANASSGVNLALTKYDLKSSHDLSKLFGSLGLSVAILLGGVAMIVKSRSNR